MAYDKDKKPIWWLDAYGQPCWFANGQPSIDGKCIWCGTASVLHREPESVAAGDTGSTTKEK